MAEFAPAYERTHIIEGGFRLSTHHSDRGGMTYGGIARRRWPGWPGWTLLDRGLPEDGPAVKRHHREFFIEHFWDALWLGEIIDQHLAEEVYDSAVNVGPETAARWLQRALNVLNRQGQLWEDLSIDGSLGPRTLEAANIAADRALAEMIKLLDAQQGVHYLRLALEDEAQEDFVRGWLVRVGL